MWIVDVPRKGNVDRNITSGETPLVGDDVPRKGNVDRNVLEQQGEAMKATGRSPQGERG